MGAGKGKARRAQGITLGRWELGLRQRQEYHKFKGSSEEVRAHRHVNQDGSQGGWVAATAEVAAGVRVDERSEVHGNAQLSDKAIVNLGGRVGGNAKLSGDAHVCEDAVVSGDAEVNGGMVCGRARVRGKAKLTDAAIYDDAVIEGSAVIGRGVWVQDKAVVKGTARVFDGVRVTGDAVVKGRSKISGGRGVVVSGGVIVDKTINEANQLEELADADVDAASARLRSSDEMNVSPVSF